MERVTTVAKATQPKERVYPSKCPALTGTSVTIKNGFPCCSNADRPSLSTLHLSMVKCRASQDAQCTRRGGAPNLSRLSNSLSATKCYSTSTLSHFSTLKYKNSFGALRRHPREREEGGGFALSEIGIPSRQRFLPLPTTILCTSFNTTRSDMTWHCR